jgi:hypothetical protein
MIRREHQRMRGLLAIAACLLAWPARAADLEQGPRLAVGFGFERLGRTLGFGAMPVVSVAGGWGRGLASSEVRASWSELYYDFQPPIGDGWAFSHGGGTLRLLGLAFSQQAGVAFRWARVSGGYEIAVARIRQELKSSFVRSSTFRSSLTCSAGPLAQLERAVVGPLFVRLEAALPLRLLKMGEEEEEAQARWTIGWRGAVAVGAAF